MSVGCLLLVLFLLSGASEGAGRVPRDNAGTKFNLHHFLEEAHSLGIINERQLAELRGLAPAAVPSSERPEESARESYSQAFSEAFLHAYNQFSLLNVLYFSGSLLVMGAFTLFSTLAWTNFGYGGVTLVLLVPLLLTGSLGVRLWEEGSYAVLGGLLCTVSTGLVPFTVYCFQRAIKWWPSEDPGLFQGFRTKVRGGWVVMELATVLTGTLFLWYGVLFPFLLFPISWMLWFLSMDLAPFLPAWYRDRRGLFEARRTLSLFFGLAMLIVGRFLELRLGSDPDFGFWLYLFGLISFWLAITFDFPEYDLHGSLYLLINISLSLAGSHLSRTTFQIFAIFGVLLYTGGIFTNYIRPEKSFVLWVLKALSVVGLFSRALRTGGSVEVVMGLVCLVAFSYSFLPFADSGIARYTFLLLTTLGFVGCAAAFRRPLDLWLFDFPDASWLVGLVASLSVGLYHIRLMKHYFRSTMDLSWRDFLLHMYRFAVSVCISVVFIFLRQPAYAWVGGLGVPLVAASLSSVRFLWHGHHDDRYRLHHKIASLMVLIAGVILSLYVESNLLYLVTCVTLLIFILTQLDNWKIGGAIFSVLLVLLSVPLQSRFLLVIGVLYIFLYLTHLAYNTFKNSILFSLSLIALGAAIIYMGYLYQTYEVAVQESFESLTPSVVQCVLNRPLSHDWIPFGQFDWYYHLQETEFSYKSLTDRPYRWLLWPAPLMHTLSKGTVPYVSTLCAVAVSLLLLAMAAVKLRQSFVVDLDGSVKVSSLSVALSQNHDGHGLVVKLKGTKPASLGRKLHIAADVSGATFWRMASDAFGGWKISFFRAVFLPLTLTPHLISFVGFTENSSEFSATILLGTGHRNTARVSHSAIQDTLRQLKRRNEAVRMTCTLLYSDTWYSPYSKLAEREITLEEIVLE